MQTRIEDLFLAQASIRHCYRIGFIDAAIAEFHHTIAPAIEAVDPRVARCARSIAASLVYMVDTDPDVVEYLNQQKATEPK